MGEMGELKTEGIVLRYADYKDADRMLTLLTPDYGLISVSARGVRRQNAQAPALPRSFLHTAAICLTIKTAGTL